MELPDLSQIQIKSQEETRNKVAKVEKSWMDFLSAGQIIRFKKDQVIFYQGHNPCGVYILLSGSVFLVDQELTCPDPIPLPLYQTIGIDLILCNQPYALTAVCQSDAITLFLSKNILQDAFNSEGSDPKTENNSFQ